MSQIQNILFLCAGNSCCSILAEGLMRYYGEGKLASFSAGSNPAGFVHPLSVMAMKRKGLDTLFAPMRKERFVRHL